MSFVKTYSIKVCNKIQTHSQRDIHKFPIKLQIMSQEP